jgi:hypothetical protein
VRVAFTGRLKHRTVASCASMLALKHGQLTASFRLGPRTAAHATIRVSAQLDHQPPVTGTLHRGLRPTPKRRPHPLPYLTGQNAKPSGRPGPNL